MIPIETGLYDQMPRLKEARNLLELYRVHQQGIPIVDDAGSLISRFDVPIIKKLRNELSSRELRPTLLHAAEYNELTPNTNAIVLEIGGTQVRLHVVHAIDENRVEYLRDGAGNEIGMELPISNKNFKDPEEFFTSMLHMVSPALDILRDKKIPIHACVTIFSFDSVAQEENGHIFLLPKEKMSKQFVVPGISQIRVGEITSRLIQDYGITFVDHFSIVDLNDGPATMLDRVGAHYSKIGGTGMNDNIAIPDGTGKFMIWNFETGDLYTFPPTLPERSVNESGENAGRHYSELKVGSANMIDVTNWIISHMINKHILTLSMNERLTGANFSDILRGNKAALKSKFDGFNSRDREQWLILTEIVGREWQNAVIPDGMISAMLINLHPQSFPNKHIYIPVDGTKFWRTPFYAQAVKSVVDCYLPQDNLYQPLQQIHFIKASGTRGGGRAGLRQFHEHNKIC
jgi:hypothetical protein